MGARHLPERWAYAVSQAISIAELAEAFYAKSPDAMLVVDAGDGRLLDANRSAEKLTGRSRTGLLASKLDQIVQWVAPGSFQVQEKGAAAAAAAYHEGLVCTATGELLPVDGITVALPQGQELRVEMVVMRDGRARRALQSGLRALMDRIAALELQQQRWQCERGTMTDRTNSIERVPEVEK